MTAHTSAKKNPVVRDLFIVGDFIKYFLRLFIPFVVIGGIYGIFYRCYLMCLLINPLIYAAGIAMIIIVIKHDVNDMLDLIGRAKQPQLALHIKHANTIQLISLQMSAREYASALETVDKLLATEPEYANAINLRGQILLEGFRNIEDSRTCFEKVLKLAKPGTDDYKLAQALRASTYRG